MALELALASEMSKGMTFVNLKGEDFKDTWEPFLSPSGVFLINVGFYVSISGRPPASPRWTSEVMEKPTLVLSIH